MEETAGITYSNSKQEYLERQTLLRQKIKQDVFNCQGLKGLIFSVEELADAVSSVAAGLALIAHKENRTR